MSDAITDKDKELLEKAEVTGRVDLTGANKPLKLDDTPEFHFMWLPDNMVFFYEAIPEFQSLTIVNRQSSKEVKAACKLGTKSNKVHGDLKLYTVTQADYRRHLAVEDAKRARRHKMIAPESVPGTRTTTELTVSRGGVTQEKFKQET